MCTSKIHINNLNILIMKKIIFIITIISLFISCSNDDNSENGNGTNIFEINFQNSSFTGSVLVTYTDGSSKSGQFENGKCILPKTESGNKTIASIQPQNQNIILIGRKEGSTINLNYNNGNLQHRVPINGFIPIGSYAEFQLINSNSNTLSNSYKMEADLDFMNINWTPIGFDYQNIFTGTFDGDNYEISNLKVIADKFAGLFGYINNSIKNIVVKSGSVKTTTTDSNFGMSGGIVSRVSSNSNNYVEISNCINYAFVEGNYVSGIVFDGIYGAGNSLYISDCKNYGEIIGKHAVSGIAGVCQTIINCHNYGDLSIITGGALSSGGVVGNVYSNGLISDCSNSGNIDGSAGSYSSVGGIVGYSTSSIISCFNKGNINITSAVKTGGIVGDFLCLGSVFVANCYNSGSITSNNSSIGTGGIIGYINGNNNSQSFSVKYCYNIGSLNSNSNSYVGSIIGFASFYSNFNSIANYWKDITNDNATNAIGYLVIGSSTGASNIGCTQFSSTSWPSVAQGWLVGNGINDQVWKSLGGWNNGNPEYPKLWYEN